MKQSQLLIPTLREAPAEAEAASHKYLLRGGFIRQLAAGIYTYLPLGNRVLHKVERIIREEMDDSGAQEVLLPALQPAELWQESGRYDVYGPELVRLHDRHDREFALGPTHEEVITTIVRNDVKSYRKFPMNFYQIQTKFRDERRPRFGLLRGREFIMKDAYSFDADWEGLDKSYWNMYNAYQRIFTRLGLNFRAVEADPGAIGGEGGTHEFMVLADIGEDTIATCDHCDYAANLEKAVSGRLATTASDQVPPIEKVHTPNQRTIQELSDFFSVPFSRLLKTLIYQADGRPVAVVVRGDHEVNEVKLKNLLNAMDVELADAKTTSEVTGAPVGYAGPIGLSIPVIIDIEAQVVQDGICGANEADMHLQHVLPERDVPSAQVADVRNVVEEDPCPKCDGKIEFYRGIEVGHVFKLGTKYSEKLGAMFLDPTGKEQPAIMGCYGIGVSRILSAIVEQSHDANGIIWPVSVAPFDVHVIPVATNDERHMAVADSIYRSLRAKGLDVLMDDRDERAGVKFKDADLIGIPVRIVVGKGAADGRVEFKRRSTGEQIDLSIEDAIQQAVADTSA